MLYKDFKKSVTYQVMKMCGEADHGRKDKIKIAPLQMVKQPSHDNDKHPSGHYHYRKEIAECFKKIPCGNICHTCLFEEATNFATEKSAFCSMHEANNHHILIFSNIVFIAWQVGIGKSTLVNLLV